jgi:anti-sigma B factor antagonist
MTLSESILGAMSDDWSAFEMAEERLGPRTTLLDVAGELDIATAPELRDRLTTVVERGATGIVVDLRDVTFMDSVAMAAILHARTQLGDKGRMAVVLGAESYTRLVFEIAGLPRCLALFEARDEAVAHVSGAAA